ncbi:hypothetical protein ACWGMW_16245 [Streptomyces albidoflavus]
MSESESTTGTPPEASSGDTLFPDEAKVNCAFPGCEKPPMPKKNPSAPGPAPKFCVDPDHTAGAKWRLERKARAEARPQPTGAAEEQDTDRPVTDAAVNSISVREQVIGHVQGLMTALPHYVDLMQTISDPEAAEAQVTATESRAATEITQANARADSERALRLAAEKAKAAAEEEKAAADQAAEQIVNEMEAAGRRAEEKIAEVQAAAEAAAQVEIDAAKAAAQAEIDAVKESAARKVKRAEECAERDVQRALDLQEEMRQRAEQEIDAAQAATEAAQERAASEVKAAEDQAGKVEVEAARRVEEMTKNLAAAEEKALAEKERADAAALDARQAHRDAQGMIAAADQAATTVRAGLEAEIKRANERLTAHEGHIDALRGEVDKLRDKVRAERDRADKAEEALRRRAPQAEAGDQPAE